MKWLKRLFSRKDDVERQYPAAPNKAARLDSEPAKPVQAEAERGGAAGYCVYGALFPANSDAKPEEDAAQAVSLTACVPETVYKCHEQPAPLSSHVPAACREAVRRTEERLHQMKVREQQKLEETLEWAADAALRASSWIDDKRRAGYRPWWDRLPVERPDKPWRSDIYDEWSELWRQLAPALQKGRRQ